MGAGLLRYTFDERRDHPANKREEEMLRLHACIWQHGDMGPQHSAAASSERRMQQPTACRKDECGMWLRSSSRTKSHMPLREAAQLGVSGLGSQVVVKRTWVEMVEAAASSLGCAAAAVVLRVLLLLFSHDKSSQSFTGAA
jgi:hypothetical protein